MLPPSATLSAAIAAIPPSTNKNQGVESLVSAISAHVNQVQAGANGTPGIFTLANAAMEDVIKDMEPVADNSWVYNFADAFEAGVVSGVITPSTVTDPTWTGSGSLDVNTLPSASATITTIADAKAQLISDLLLVAAGNTAPLPVADALHQAVLKFTFNCIGLGSPPAFPPIPLPFNAQ